LFYSNPSAFKEILQVQITLRPNPAYRKELKKNNAKNFRQTPNGLLKTDLVCISFIFSSFYLNICPNMSWSARHGHKETSIDLRNKSLRMFL